MLRRAEEKAAEAGADAMPMLILHKERFCRLEDIKVEDFEMTNYEPMQPQLKFELGI